MTREVHRSSLRRLIFPAQEHFIFLTVLIISMTFVLSLTQMLVFLYVYVMLSILLSILVFAAASLLCACLVSVQVSAPYAVAGSTHELYTCLPVFSVGETGVGWDSAPQCQTRGQKATLMMFSESTWSRPILVLHAIVTHVLRVKYRQN